MGSGYTTEGQKTGQEKYGGLQIEVIPEYQRDLRKWLPDNLSASTMTAILNGDSSYFLPETSTAAELSLRPGDKIRSYPSSLRTFKYVKISDLIGPEETEVNLMATNVQEVSSWAWNPHMAFQHQLPIQMQWRGSSPSAYFSPRYHNYTIPKIRPGRRRSTKIESQSLGLAAGAKLSMWFLPLLSTYSSFIYLSISCLEVKC